MSGTTGTKRLALNTARRIARRGLLCMGGVWITVPTVMLLAQRQAAQTPSAQTAAVTPQIYPGIPVAPTDTGRMRPGWQEFSRYGWVGGRAMMCAQAARQVTERVWRHGEHDTADYVVRARDTLPPAVRMVAERCGADTAFANGLPRVLSATDGEHPLFFALYDLASVFHKEREAHDMFVRRLKQFPTLNDSAKAVMGKWRLDIQQHPIGVARVEALLPLLDSVRRAPEAPDMDVARMSIHQWLWSHWYNMGDTARLRAAIESEIVAMRDSPARAIYGGYWEQEEYDNLIDLEALGRGVRSPQTVAALQREDRDIKGSTRSLYHVSHFRLYGKPFVYPETEYWYAADGTQTKGHVPPAKVTIIWSPIWQFDHTCTFRNDPGFQTHNTVCQQLWGGLHKLLDKYGSQGVQLVILAHTRGFTLGDGGELAPEQEAPAIRQFYQDELKFKAPVSVDVTPYTFKPAPDSRRVNGHTPWSERYLFGWPNTPGTPGPLANPPRLWLLDGNGNIQYIQYYYMPFGDEMPVVKMYIEKILKQQQ